MVKITCPHCQFSKAVASEKLPKGSGRIRCPKCREFFAPPKPVAPPHDKPSPPPPSPPAEKAAPALPAGSAVRVSCPHCGLQKNVPADKIPPDVSRVRCQKCGQMFDLARHSAIVTAPPAAEPPPGQAPVPPAPARHRELIGIGDLFTRSWEIFRRRIATLVGVNLLGAILALIPLFAFSQAGDQLAAAFPGSPLVAASGTLLGALLGAAVFAWLGAAVLYAVVDEDLGVREALGMGLQRIGAFIWLFALLMFIVTGGYFLLIIPGMLFSLWFFFAPYILAGEDLRGMEALIKSREYLRGYGPAVLGRLLLLGLVTSAVSMLLGLIPIIGPLLALLLMPFTLIFYNLIYQDLRDAKGSLSYACSRQEKAKWLGAGALGFVAVPLIALAIGGSSLIGSAYFMGAMMISDQPVITMAPALGNPDEPLPEQLGEEVPTPQKLSRAEYRARLATPPPAFAEGPTTFSGPAALQLDHFWEDPQAPHLWLKVRSLPLPNLDLMDGKAFKVTIARALDASGRDHYDRENGFEKEFFQQVNFSPAEEVLEGIRDIHLMAGATHNNLTRVEGNLELSLPEGLEVREIGPEMTDRELAIAGKTLVLKGIQESSVLVEFRGNYDHLLKLAAYNAQGQPLSGAGSSWSTQGEVTTLNKMFSGQVASLKVVVAADLAHWSYPFTLER